jgi:hypothetical protein
MPYSKEALSKAIAAVVDYHRLPEEIQKELVKRLREKCEERQLIGGLSEVEALAHALHAIKDQIHSLSAPYLAPTSIYRRDRPPTGILLLALVHWLILVFLLLIISPDFYLERGIDSSPALAFFILKLSKFMKDFWPIPVLVAAAIATLSLVQLRHRAPLWRRMELTAWGVILAVLILEIATLLGCVLPLWETNHMGPA